MREATGGVLLLQLVVIILSVFIFFIASTMQYTRVYRIKGTVINAIERNEGGIRDAAEFKEVLNRAGYDGPFVFCKCRSKARGTYYKLEIYASFTILPTIGSLKIPISGNTNPINSGVYYQDDQKDVFITSGKYGNKVKSICDTQATTVGCLVKN